MKSLFHTGVFLTFLAILCAVVMAGAGVATLIADTAGGGAMLRNLEAAYYHFFPVAAAAPVPTPGPCPCPCTGGNPCNCGCHCGSKCQCDPCKCPSIEIVPGPGPDRPGGKCKDKR